VAGSCEYGYEPSGSGVTNLVRWLVGLSVGCWVTTQTFHFTVTQAESPHWSDNTPLSASLYREWCVPWLVM
jgi:hypothetical protein